MYIDKNNAPKELNQATSDELTEVELDTVAAGSSKRSRHVGIGSTPGVTVQNGPGRCDVCGGYSNLSYTYALHS